MTVVLKAILFHTRQLKETRLFFEAQTGVRIVESSPTHFSLHSNGIRVVFIQCDDDQTGTGFYLQSDEERGPGKRLTQLQDPNGIAVILINQKK